MTATGQEDDPPLRPPSQTLTSIPVQAPPRDTTPAPNMTGVQADELLETMRLVRKDVANYALRVEGLPGQLSALTNELVAMRNLMGSSIDALGAEISESREASKQRDYLLGVVLGRIEHELGQTHEFMKRTSEMVGGVQELAKSALDVATEAKTLIGNTYTAVTGRGHAERAATPAPPAQRRPKRPPR